MASARKPQREWTQLRKTPQRRTRETTVRGKKSEYSRIPQLKRVQNGVCTQIAEGAGTAVPDAAAWYHSHRQPKHEREN